MAHSGRGELVRRTELMKCRICPWSVRLDARKPDDLCPLLGFVGDELAEIGRRACQHHPAEIQKPRLDLRIEEARIDLLVKPIYDLGGGVPGRADAGPDAGLITRH